MPDFWSNQGTGLHHVGMKSAARMIAITGHGDHQCELPLLWSLCSALVDLGYCVTVLDATMEEHNDEPGLEQMLDDAYWERDAPSSHASWSIIPATKGIRLICQRATHKTPALTALNGLFDNGEVVVIFATADILGKLLRDTGVEPLIAVSDKRMSLMTGYRALKTMLLDGNIRPIIATVANESNLTPGIPSPTAGRHLLDCADNFLGCSLSTPLSVAISAQERYSPDMNRLILRMLATAKELDQPIHTAPWSQRAPVHEQISGSH
jgi:hypothetical protein